MKRFGDILEKIIGVCLVVFVATLTVSTAFQVLSRYVLRIPIMWTEELAVMSFVWMTMLGASIGVRKSEHYVINLFSDTLNRKNSAVLELVVYLIMLAVSWVFISGGYEFAIRGMNRDSLTLGIKMVWVYAAMPVSGIMMALFLLEQLPQKLSSVKTAFQNGA